jgi:DivIVA domain-containing protein
MMDNRNNQAQSGQNTNNAPQGHRLNLTPTDIVNQDFGHKMRGYDSEEVDNYLDLVIKDYETYNEQIKAIQQENNRLKSRIDELTKQLSAQGPAVAGNSSAGSGSSASNYDILKRLSNLERHVFGVSKANPVPSVQRSYVPPRYNSAPAQGPTNRFAGPGMQTSPNPPMTHRGEETPQYSQPAQYQEPQTPNQPASRQNPAPQPQVNRGPQQPQSTPVAEPSAKSDPYQNQVGGGTQYRNYGPQSPENQTNNGYVNPNPAPQPSGENNYRPQQ